MADDVLSPGPQVRQLLMLLGRGTVCTVRERRKCVQFLHIGPTNGLPEILEGLYSHYLPQQDLESDGPYHEIYLDDWSRVAPQQRVEVVGLAVLERLDDEALDAPRLALPPGHPRGAVGRRSGAGRRDAWVGLRDASGRRRDVRCDVCSGADRVGSYRRLPGREPAAAGRAASYGAQEAPSASPAEPEKIRRIGKGRRPPSPSRRGRSQSRGSKKDKDSRRRSDSRSARGR